MRVVLRLSWDIDTLHEDVASIYVGTQRSFDSGLSFNASARWEYFRIVAAYCHSEWSGVSQGYVMVVDRRQHSVCVGEVAERAGR